MDGGASGGLGLYLVERYWPDVTPEEFEAAVADVVDAAEDISRTGLAVRHLQSLLALPEDVVFSLFEACSSDAVAHANRVSGWAFERVVPALLAGGPQTRRRPRSP